MSQAFFKPFKLGLLTGLALIVAVVLLTACGGAATPTAAPAPAAVTPEAVIAAFKAAGLEAESPRALTRDDYGAAPLVGKGVRFLIPSLGADAGGRVVVGPPADLTRLQTYYVELGKSSAAFSSHVYLHDGVLVQINGKLPDAEAARYEAALNGL